MSTEKTKLEALLHEFADVLSVSDDDLGHTNIVKHHISIGDATPVRQPPRRLRVSNPVLVFPNTYTQTRSKF